MALERAIDPGMVRRLFPRGSERTLYLLRVAWPVAVGDELSRRTEVLAIEGDTLRIMVPSGGWQKVLHRLAPQILRRLREALGEVAPRRLGFTEGAVAETPPAPVAEHATTPGELPESLRQAALGIPDPEIRAAFLETAARYLERSNRHD
jgi:hypothetical protein